MYWYLAYVSEVQFCSNEATSIQNCPPQEA